jgi:pimeloyl-ACP methyl ester carboxylesterase
MKAPGMDEGFVQLADGRRLAYRTNGPTDGLPLYFFHGLAESRLTVHPDESILEELGICLVAIDRPGVGLSDPYPGRTLLDWPPDMVALSDQLGHQQFSVMGHSAGAPYVAACAYTMPDRLLSASIVSGISPPSRRLVRPMLASEFWKMGMLLFCVPLLTKPVLWAGIKYARPRIDRLYARHLSHLAQADRDVMADPAMKDMRILSLLEAIEQGPEGLCEDICLLRRPWGFDPSTIMLPVRIWHGELDKIIDVSFGRELARLLPNSVAEFRDGLGHNMLFSHWREILAGVKDDVGRKLQVSS